MWFLCDKSFRCGKAEIKLHTWTVESMDPTDHDNSALGELDRQNCCLSLFCDGEACGQQDFELASANNLFSPPDEILFAVGFEFVGIQSR